MKKIWVAASVAGFTAVGTAWWAMYGDGAGHDSATQAASASRDTAAAASRPEAAPVSPPAQAPTVLPATGAGADSQLAAIRSDIARLWKDEAGSGCKDLLPKLAEAVALVGAGSEESRGFTWKQQSCLLQLGRNGEALALLAQVLQRNPPDRKLLVMLAQEYRLRRKYDMAEALAEDALALGRDSEALELMSSVTLHKSYSVQAGSPEQARQESERLRVLAAGYLREAVDLAPESQRGFMRMELAKELIAPPVRLDEALKAGQQGLDEARASVGHGLSTSGLAHMYVDFGRMLYQHGQKDTGDGYMVQGIQMTPSESFRHILTLIRKSVVGEALTGQEAAEISSYTIPED